MIFYSLCFLGTQNTFGLSVFAEDISSDTLSGSETNADCDLTNIKDIVYQCVVANADVGTCLKDSQKVGQTSLDCSCMRASKNVQTCLAGCWSIIEVQLCAAESPEESSPQALGGASSGDSVPDTSLVGDKTEHDCNPSTIEALTRKCVKLDSGLTRYVATVSPIRTFMRKN